MSYAQFEKQTVPSNPGPGKVRWFHNVADGKPYYVDENGTVNSFIGPKGDTGDPGSDGAPGPQGDPGIQGLPGPAGSMSLVHKNTFSGVMTLPNVVSKSFVWRTSFTVVPNTDGYLLATIGFKGHSTGNDCEFDWTLNGSILDGDLVEEVKDTSNSAKNLRTFQIDLGVLNNGAYDLDLFFSKESTGGTAQIKYIAVLVMGV